MTLHIVLIFVTQWMYFLLGTGEPKLDYHPPLDIPLTLAANFGELRSNHFHMGIDLKTQGKEGLSLYSIDDGYISRVNISPYGYGLTVYINHSGGITSVYAHCSELIGKLDSKIKSIQKEKKSSEIEVYFGPNEMPIKRAEIFALSGNSGSSRGPHLHFEIRDSYTDEAFNPLLFGFKIADSRKPELRHLKLFSLDENAFSMNGTKEYKIYKKGDQYVLDAPIQISPSFFSKKGGIGFALSGVDFYDAYNNVCGLYGLKLSIDQQPFFEQKLERIKFEHTRYINTYTDYSTANNGRYYHKSFRNSANLLGVYNQSSLGVFQPKPNSNHRIKYEVYDVAGNISILEFDLIVSEGEYKSENSFSPLSNYYFPHEIYYVSNEFGEIEIPRHCSYEPIGRASNISSNSATLRSDNLPVQDAYTVRLKPLLTVPVSKQYLRTNGQRALLSIYHNGYIEGTSRYFGTTSVETDLNPPTIRASNIRATVKKSQTRRLVWFMGDNESGLKDYGIKINGVWEVLSYESKGGYAYLNCDFLPLGECLLEVIAIDYCGNQKTINHSITVQ